MALNNTTSLESVTWLQNDLYIARLKYYIVEKSAFVVLAVSVLLFSYFLYGLTDYLVRFPRVIRLLITACLSAGVIYFINHFISRSMKNMDNAESVARLVESVKEKEGNSQCSTLISALQFGVQPEIPGSAYLKNETIRLARTRCARPSKAPLYDKKLVRRAIQAVAAVFPVYLICLIFFSGDMKVFLKRSLAFNAQYATTTKIVKIKWQPHAPAYVDYPVEIRVKGRLPSAGKIILAYEGERKFPVILAQDEKIPSIYKAIVSNPLKSFRFKFIIGDYESGMYAVHIDIPPFIKTGKIEIKPPAYTGRKLRKTNFENINVPQNSSLVFRVQPDRPIAECAFLINDESSGVMTKKEANYEFFLKAEQSALFSIRLIDKDGLQNSERVSYFMNVMPDQPPVVNFSAPESGASFARHGRVHFQIKAEDDYGIHSAKICYKIHRADNKNKSYAEKIIKKGEMPIDLTGAGKTERVHLDKLIQSFGAVDGDHIGVTAVAFDNYPGAPHKGVSDEISLSVVSSEDVRIIDKAQAASNERLLRDIKQARNKITEILKKQEMLKDMLKKIDEYNKAIENTAEEKDSDKALEKALGIVIKLDELKRQLNKIKLKNATKKIKDAQDNLRQNQSAQALKNLKEAKENVQAYARTIFSEINNRIKQEEQLSDAGQAVDKVKGGWLERLPGRERQALLSAQKESSAPQMMESIKQYYVNLAK